jgi:hypothetical protein
MAKWRFPIATLLIVGMAALILPSATFAVPKKGSKPKKPPSCANLVTPRHLKEVVGGEPALAAKPVEKTDELWADLPGGLGDSKIASTECGYDWVYPDGGHPQGDPDPRGSTGYRSPPSIVAVGWDVTSGEWHNIRNNEAEYVGTRTDTCSGCAWQPPRSLKLGHGSKAFVVSYDENDEPEPEAPTYTWENAYEIYVLTKTHNIFELAIWPLTLEKEEALAKQILAQGRF